MEIQKYKKFLGHYIVFTALFTILLTPLMGALYVFAGPVYGHYPSQGIFKMSLNKTTNRGQIGMSSNRYEPELLNAYTKVKTSTTGYSEMPSSVWPTGYNMLQNNWNGQWNMYVDTLIYFTYRGPNQSPGQIYRSLARSDFCSLWGQSYPCGMRSTVEIDTWRWDGQYASNPTLKQRLIMHETGHAIGMLDYCAQDSIMNDGTGGCNGGKWSAVMSYQPTDRTAINSVYR